MTVQKKFLVSAADAYLYDVSNGDLLAVGKTLLDTSISSSISNQDVRGGRGNPLLYVFWHSAEFQGKISDAQWNLDMLARNTGSEVVTGKNVFTEEVVTLAAGGGGSVTGTPVASVGTNLYGWCTLPSGVVEKVTFNVKAFTTSGGAENDKCTVRYYANNAAARSMTVRSDMIPQVVKIVLEAQLVSPDATTNRIGTLQIEIPRASLTGAMEISMTADGVASTPLNFRAFRQEETATDGSIVPVYAYLTEILDNANWYDNVIGLSIVGGDFTLANGTTKTLDVRAIPSNGAAFKPPYADLTFASSDATKATVSSAGVVTWVAAGPTTVKVSITSKNTIDANIVVTAGA